MERVPEEILRYMRVRAEKELTCERLEQEANTLVGTANGSIVALQRSGNATWSTVNLRCPLSSDVHTSLFDKGKKDLQECCAIGT